jgi:hypothetical protein
VLSIRPDSFLCCSSWPVLFSPFCLLDELDEGMPYNIFCLDNLGMAINRYNSTPVTSLGQHSHVVVPRAMMIIVLSENLVVCIYKFGFSENYALSTEMGK